MMSLICFICMTFIIMIMFFNMELHRLSITSIRSYSYWHAKFFDGIRQRLFYLHNDTYSRKCGMLTHGNSTILLLTRHRVLAKCMFIFGNVYMRIYIFAHRTKPQLAKTNARRMLDVKRECTQYFVFISMLVKIFWHRVY